MMFKEYGMSFNIILFRTLRAEKNILMQRKQAKIAEMEKSAFSVSKTLPLDCKQNCVLFHIYLIIKVHITLYIMYQLISFTSNDFCCTTV